MVAQDMFSLLDSGHHQEHQHTSTGTSWNMISAGKGDSDSSPGGPGPWVPQRKKGTGEASNGSQGLFLLGLVIYKNSISLVRSKKAWIPSLDNPPDLFLFFNSLCELAGVKTGFLKHS